MKSWASFWMGAIAVACVVIVFFSIRKGDNA